MASAKRALTAWFILAGVIVAFALIALLAGCRADTGNGDSQPQPRHTTSVGPSASAKASIIPKDTTVVFPKNPAEVKYAVDHGATFICGDGGMSYASLPDACVGHGKPSEVVRK